MVTTILFVLVLSFLFLGVPVAVSLGLSSILVIAFFSGDSMSSMALQLFSSSQKFTLLAIPFFILASAFMSTGGVAKRIIRFAVATVGHFRGGLAMASVLACMMFAALSGSSPATVVAIGTIAIAGMREVGYSKDFAAGIIANAGTLGILIPPSIMLIVYSATSAVSVVKLYAAAMIPGILLAGLYVIYVISISALNPKLAPKLPKEQTDIPFGRVIILLVTSFFPLALLILAVLGTILFGLATPSEAAAVGALGAMLIATGYRAMTWQRLKEAVFLTARTSAMVCWLFVGSWTFSSIFSYLGGEGLIKEFVTSIDLSTVQFLILAQVIIFLLGWPLEWSEIIIIFVPIFLPLLNHYHVDPMYFGILVALNLQTSFLTPPMAMSAYYLKGVAPPHVQLWTIFRGCFPFLTMVFISMILVYVFPQLVYWLPRLIYGH